MSKNKRNWCDSKYEKKESTFDTGYLSERLVDTLTEWVIRDFTIVQGMNQYQIDVQRRRTHKLLDIAEQIECLTKDANSIYMTKEIDYIERRQKWLRARGYCFQLTAMLSHVINYVEKGTNIQKYLNIQSDVKEIGSKIKNMMISDTERFKNQGNS